MGVTDGSKSASDLATGQRLLRIEVLTRLCHGPVPAAILPQAKVRSSSARSRDILAEIGSGHPELESSDLAMRVRPTVPVPPELLVRPFTVEQAAELHLPSHFLKSRRFTKLFHGVYVSSGIKVKLSVRATAARLEVRRVLRDAQPIFSHQTAALMRRLPVDDDEAIHLTVPPTNRRVRLKGITMHYRELDPAKDLEPGSPT